MNNLFKILRKQKTGCWVNNNFHGMAGYSDDNWVLSPTLSGLQEMMSTIEIYCHDHNLEFSTDPNPSKCKTKCLAFLKKNRPLPSVKLCGNSLPWVKEGIHLGNHFETKYNGMKKDILNKRASFISKSCEISQEFSYASPETLLKINSIYNLHMTGSPT